MFSWCFADKHVEPVSESATCAGSDPAISANSAKSAESRRSPHQEKFIRRCLFASVPLATVTLVFAFAKLFQGFPFLPLGCEDDALVFVFFLQLSQVLLQHDLPAIRGSLAIGIEMQFRAAHLGTHLFRETTSRFALFPLNGMQFSSHNGDPLSDPL
jgi:hypothetical protein